MGWTLPRLIAVKGKRRAAGAADECSAVQSQAVDNVEHRRIGGHVKIAIQQWHYVGETTNERSRIKCYARNGSHLSKIINRHLNAGWHLYYRATGCVSKIAAKQMQDNLLNRFKYDWNKMLNGD